MIVMVGGGGGVVVVVDRWSCSRLMGPDAGEDKRLGLLCKPIGRTNGRPVQSSSAGRATTKSLSPKSRGTGSNCGVGLRSLSFLFARFTCGVEQGCTSA